MCNVPGGCSHKLFEYAHTGARQHNRPGSALQDRRETACPADQRLETRLQLEQGKGLRQIVVGSGVESAELIRLRTARSEEYYQAMLTASFCPVFEAKAR